MTTFDIAATRTQLKTLLQTVSGIAFVYDYSNPNIAGFPAVIFDVTNEEAEMLDDSNNLRAITFSIYVLQEITVAGEQTAKAMLDVAAKSVFDTLEKKVNDSLSNTVDWVMPINGRRMHTQTPSGAAFMQEIQLKVKIASTIL